jgi:hypothetical protein
LIENREKLKGAAAKVWALLLRARERGGLDYREGDSLQAALLVLSEGLTNDAFATKRARELAESIRSSGLLSIPARKVEGFERLLSDCEQLQRHLSGQ